MKIALLPPGATQSQINCASKERFNNKQRARERAKHLRQRGHSPRLWPYHCPECGLWHLSKQQPNTLTDMEALALQAIASTGHLYRRNEHDFWRDGDGKIIKISRAKGKRCALPTSIVQKLLTRCLLVPVQPGKAYTLSPMAQKEVAQ